MAGRRRLFAAGLLLAIAFHGRVPTLWTFALQRLCIAPPRVETLQEVLERQGYLRCGSFDKADAQALHDTIWNYWPRHYGISLCDPSTWREMGQREGKRSYKPAFPALVTSRAWQSMVARIDRACGETFGGRWRCKEQVATVLVSCPGLDWRPPTSWHTDEELQPLQDEPENYLVFALLDDVAPKGGATMILSDSVRQAKLYNRTFPLGGSDLKTVLAEDDSFCRALFSASPDQTEDMGRNPKAPLSVHELFGSSGDLTIWDPRALHTATANANDRPRTAIRLALESVA